MPEFVRYWRQEYSAGGGPVTQAFSQRIGAVLAYIGQQVGATPNQLTALGLACYLTAATLYAFLPPGFEAALACALVYQLAYAFDCSDGQLARAHSRASEFGGWWDVSADAVSSLALVFALLYWLASRAGGLDPVVLLVVFPLAAGKILTLYSSKAAAASDRGTGGGSHGASPRQLLKWVLWLVVDTPTLLLLICLLREAPTLLGAYLVGIGIAYCMNAGYLGLTKLQRT